jgi:hypothetical protein
MTTSNSRNGCKPRPVPELIKELWSLYFELSLDPLLEASAAHVRSAALSLEHTRRMAYEVTQEPLSQMMDDLDGEDGHRSEEDELVLSARNQKFGSVMKH